MNTKKKIFVGVSGGVDSSVALALLQKQNYDVTGVFLKTWYPEWMQCDWKEERRSAMRVCATLGVSFLTLDCEKEYKEEVVDYMIREYSIGRVPNPDIFCNKFVKFGIFLKKALEIGADFVATGHYARVREFSISNLQFSNKNTKYELLESVDKEKDQSYFLYTLGQEELKHTLFPVGGMIKSEVRKLAQRFGLPTATKKDSQGLCFIGKVDMKDFLAHYIPKKRGVVLNTNGDIIGHHDGAVLYAIGERHGFTITNKTPNDPRYFVVSKDIKKNTLTVASQESESEKVNNIKEIFIKNLHFISGNSNGGRTSIRIRYHQKPQFCVIEKRDGGYSIIFDILQNAISVGQSAVFYDGEICLGGGIIDTVI